MKKILIISFLIIAIIALSSCEVASSPSVSQLETKAVQENMKEMSKQVGNPNIQNFYEKRLAKKIFELRDDSKLITYAYMQNLEGQFVYIGKCVGFGLPYSVQYTNPELLKTGGYNDNRWAISLPQADPNGLYMPEGLSATWLIIMDEKTNETSVMYTEPSIVVTQFKLPKRLIADWSLPESY